MSACNSSIFLRKISSRDSAESPAAPPGRGMDEDFRDKMLPERANMADAGGPRPLLPPAVPTLAPSPGPVTPSTPPPHTPQHHVEFAIDLHSKVVSTEAATKPTHAHTPAAAELPRRAPDKLLDVRFSRREAVALSGSSCCGGSDVDPKEEDRLCALR